MKATTVLVFLICVVPAFMRIKECRSPADCGPKQCCVVGMNTYSVPHCEPLGQIGATCLMVNEPEDKSLYYPNGVVDVYGVYRLFCPCAEHLHCKEARCSYF